MSPLNWFEFALGAVTVTALNVFFTFWRMRKYRQSARLSAGTERKALSAEVETLRRELNELRARPSSDEQPPNGSAYERAIDMARAGTDVSVIAAACGITRGEAELVFALHRSGISSM